MDHKTLVDRLAKSLKRDKNDINKLVEALSNVVTERCSELDNVVVPGFGTIEAVKQNESVESDSESGKRMLFPPRIVMNFVGSNVLKKQLNQSES